MRSRFQTLRILIVLCLIGPPNRCEASDLSADKLLDPSHIVAVEIEMPEEDWRALCNQSRDVGMAFTDPSAKPYSYFKGKIKIDGVEIDEVGIRKKGFIGSQDSVRPSLKVDFSEYVDQRPVPGISQLTLNNNKQDRSLLSQCLTYYVFRKAGVHAPRCNFATVTVNGQYLGVYANVESIKADYLTNEFGDASGKLYEGTLADFYPKGVDRLEAKNQSADKDRTKVMRLAQLLNADKPVELDAIEEIVDVDNFLKFWAIESLIGFWDGYTQNQNNYFVYENPRNGKLYFMPWGADGCFSEFGGFGRFGGGSRSAASLRESMLANRLFYLDGIPERYRNTLTAILSDVWDERVLLAEVSRLKKLIFNDLSEQQIDAIREMRNVRRFIQNRREKVEAELERWPVAVAAIPRKPMYTVPIGTAKGTFKTRWDTEAETQKAGTVALTMDGRKVDLDGVRVSARIAEQSGRRFGPFGGRNPNPPVSILVQCETEFDPMLTLTINIPKQDFVASNKQKRTVNGSYSQGERRGFGFDFGKSLQGEVVLDAAGMEKDDLVSGRFDLKIAETRGGMMDRRGR